MLPCMSQNETSNELQLRFKFSPHAQDATAVCPALEHLPTVKPHGVGAGVYGIEVGARLVAPELGEYLTEPISIWGGPVTIRELCPTFHAGSDLAELGIGE